MKEFEDVAIDEWQGVWHLRCGINVAGDGTVSAFMKASNLYWEMSGLSHPINVLQQRLGGTRVAEMER